MKSNQINGVGEVCTNFETIPTSDASDRVIEVTTASQYSAAKDLLVKVFTDPTDLEPEEELDRFFATPEIARYLLFVRRGREIGAGLVRINPHVRAMYVPYTGILKGHSFPNMKQVFVDLMRKLGVRWTLVDVEDPARIRGVYPTEDQAQYMRYCEARLRWFRTRMGARFIDDPRLPYCRPASNDPRRGIQAYDILGFVPASDNDPELLQHLNGAQNEASLSLYERFHLELMQLEYGTASEVPTQAELMRNYRAIKHFVDRLNAIRNDTSWMKLRRPLA